MNTPTVPPHLLARRWTNFVPTAADYALVRTVSTNFRLIFHYGDMVKQGHTVSMCIASTDPTDVVACRVLEAFHIPHANCVLIQFTTAEPKGARIAPNFCGIHTRKEVYIHVKPICCEDLKAVRAGMRVLRLLPEDDDAKNLDTKKMKK